MAQDEADARRMLDTTRRVATPEGIELTLVLAGPVPRALAWLLDFLLRAAVVLVVAMVAAYFGRAGWGLVALMAFFVEWLAPAWFEVRWNGQTPGKRVLGLSVVHDDGTPVRWGPSLTRNLLRAVDFLPFFYGIGLSVMLASRDFKRLGDLAAGTVVVYAPGRAAARALPEAPPLAPRVPLSLEEQRVVLELAERSASLTPERLEELAELAAPITGTADGRASAARLLGLASHLAGRR
ncbi:MAG TPA: RDD family protein [Burkholderiales bacterium]|nr:RDD family protein [Burkholderiales bacterium]